MDVDWSAGRLGAGGTSAPVFPPPTTTTTTTAQPSSGSSKTTSGSSMSSAPLGTLPRVVEPGSAGGAPSSRTPAGPQPGPAHPDMGAPSGVYQTIGCGQAPPGPAVPPPNNWYQTWPSMHGSQLGWPSTPMNMVSCLSVLYSVLST